MTSLLNNNEISDLSLLNLDSLNFENFKTINSLNKKEKTNENGPTEFNDILYKNNQKNDNKIEIIEDFDDSSYHCPFLLSMDFNSLDPSLALAFICLCEEDYEDLVKLLKVRFNDFLIFY